MAQDERVSRFTKWFNERTQSERIAVLHFLYGDAVFRLVERPTGSREEQLRGNFLIGDVLSSPVSREIECPQCQHKWTP
jgi:hypothetical protein